MPCSVQCSMCSMMCKGEDSCAFAGACALQKMKIQPFKQNKSNGLQRQRLIGSAAARFNHARTTTKVSATDLDGRQNDYSKGICSPGSLFNNPVRLRQDSLNALFSLKGHFIFDLSNVTK